MAHAGHDDSFREIQLSGKQLVFLFMAVIVILVGVFLMGLQVGRGVLMARGAPGAAESTTAANETDPPPPPASATASSTSSPATAGEKLSYAERLGSPEPPKESLKPSPPETPPTPKPESPAPAATTPATTAPSTAPAAKPPASKSATPAAAASVVKSAEPAGTGFAVQVAALREPDEAEAIVKRLAGKGYPAYVVTPVKGEPAVYRVRVGKFKERREADTVAARLQKEEQFKPWIVR